MAHILLNPIHMKKVIRPIPLWHSFYTSLAFALYLFCFCSISLVWAVPEDDGLEGDFLAWGAGARALALGKAYVALATDATAGYWNPAGLAFVDQPQASALHAMLWEGANYDFVGVAIPTLTFGTVGWFGSVMASGELERRDVENNPVSGGFGVTKVGTGLAYGWDLQPDLGLGVTLKWLARWFDGSPSGFVTMDLGVRYVLGTWGVIAGVWQHGLSVRYGDTEDALPGQVRLGLVLSPLADLGKLVVDAEFGKPRQAAKWRIGMETAPIGPLVGRVGMDTWELAGGLGVTVEEFHLDYGGAFHRELGWSHRFSLSTQWGEPQSTLRVNFARAAFDQALEALAEADRKGRDTEAGRAAVERARATLSEAAQYDKTNPAILRLLRRLAVPVKP